MRLSFPGLGEEGAELPKTEQAVRNLYSALHQGEWKPSNLAAIGTNVVQTKGMFQLVGNACFVFLEFTADSIAWTYNSDPKLPLPISTRGVSPGQIGAFAPPDALTFADSNGLVGQQLMIYNRTENGLLVGELNPIPSISIAVASTFYISGYYLLLN